MSGAAESGVPLTDTPAGRFTLRPADQDHDLETVHAWMNDPEVARYWDLALPLDGIADYLRQQTSGGHSAAWLGCLDGTPMSYWELYRADLDPLAAHYPAAPHDAGVHLLFGSAHHRGRGLAAALLRAVTDHQFAVDPAARRVIAEPDVHNTRSVRAFHRAGFRADRELRLPDKRAQLMVRERTP